MLPHSSQRQNSPIYSPAEPPPSSILPPLRLATSQPLHGPGRPVAIEPPSGPISVPGPWPSSSGAPSQRLPASSDAHFGHLPRDYDATQGNQLGWSPDAGPQRPGSSGSHYAAGPVYGNPQTGSPHSGSPQDSYRYGSGASASTSWHQRPSNPAVAQSQPCNLRIRQQPEVARACGFGERDRRVIDPPPILELSLSSEELAQNEDEEAEGQVPVYIAHASLWSEDGTEDVTTFVQPTKKSARRLVGTLVSSGTIARDEHEHKGCFFTFADLSCRSNGRYRLRFNLVKIDPRNMRPGTSSPLLASVLSDVLTVYSPKDFPGMRRSTPLTQALKNQGVSVPAKKSKLSGSNRARHGECFVLDDGGEVDLDLGNYERYLNITLTRENNITTGKIYQQVIERERRGDYLGRTVQVVPHVTDAIQEWIQRVAQIPVDDSNETPDVCIVELGGTVGDIESAPFIEAMRSLRRRAGKNNFLQIHVSLVPVIGGEQKTKPTQQAIRDVRSAGLSPDLIACRCPMKLAKSTTDKIAHFCQVDEDQVIAVHDVNSTYHVPMLLEDQGMIKSLREILQLDQVPRSPDILAKGEYTWKEWKSLAFAQDRLFDEVNIALVGKYTNLHDSYLSVIKSLEHAAMHCKRKLNLIWVDASELEKGTRDSDPAKFHKAWHQVCTAQGILVPGGFGTRGTEGMVAAATWARQNKTPFLGICLGMQLAVIEYARSVCSIADATSSEFNGDATNPVIVYMPEIDKAKLGGTMRLGLRATNFQSGSEWSKLRALYGDAPSVMERHRHRYEVNPAYIEQLEGAGLNFIGKDEEGRRMEMVEVKDHPWYVGVQFHPEYLSRVLAPSKPYLGFVAASAGIYDSVLQETLANESKLQVNRAARLTNGTAASNPSSHGTELQDPAIIEATAALNKAQV
ncbi:hypothetical protein FH972_026123 [Carpinus fangiana]|uniref:CTP synthase n=1 Tax=Carpinus fangiana TaxID=176857 RepID=A0A5N6L334_9ROSI|nr:hypothetical protein FH972_026123 [Carpinus fangiana]